MSDDFVLVRILAVCTAQRDSDLLRQGATLAAIPAHFIHAATVAAARVALAEGNVDIALFDSAMAEPDLQKVAKAARAARNSPSVVLLASSGAAATDRVAEGSADAIAVRPASLPDAKALIEGCTRLRVPSRVLLVDHSSTVRSIVRKILAGCRFPLDISEAAEGIDALKRIGAGNFDLVFLDYDMPGLDGIELLAKFRRQHPRMEVVMMTSAAGAGLAARAHVAGAAGVLKKPFYPSDIDAILYAMHGLRPPAA